MPVLLDTRQHRPMAHHAHERLEPAEWHRRGYAAAGDRTAAGRWHPWIEVLAAGQSAEVRVASPLRWK
jgi:hypothetical protein